MPPYTFDHHVDVACPVEDVWDFHNSRDAFPNLTPPNQKVEVLDDGGGLVENTLQKFRVKQGPLRLEWHARIIEVTPPNGFTDVAEKAPFGMWRHRHQFDSIPGGTRISDRIEYTMKFGFLGRIAHALFARRQIEALFAYRTQVFIKKFGELK